jgi:small basic protein (TIGR04137 family)
MTIDKSLRIRAGASKQRSVLTRAERIAKLKENDRWAEGDKVLGLPKVRVSWQSRKRRRPRDLRPKPVPKKPLEQVLRPRPPPKLQPKSNCRRPSGVALQASAVCALARILFF